MGTYDFMKTILKEMGTIHFGRMKMKPGKPTTFATIPRNNQNNLLIFSLPGNPVSCYVTANLLIIPTLKTLCSGGVNEYKNKEVDVILTENVKLDPIRPEYHRASLNYHNGNFYGTSTGVQRSSRVLSLRNADGLLHLPTGEKALKEGTKVKCTILNPLRFRCSY
eukprot:UN30315